MNPGADSLAGLLEVEEREPWRQRAACRNHPTPDAWFPLHPQVPPEAAAVCATCPVQLPCEQHAVLHGEQHDVVEQQQQA